jgi:hypothetical protein
MHGWRLLYRFVDADVAVVGGVAHGRGNGTRLGMMICCCCRCHIVIVAAASHRPVEGRLARMITIVTHNPHIIRCCGSGRDHRRRIRAQLLVKGPTG